MPRRSITDEEIALIKRMLARGMRNTDIQFYFNKQDRPVNSGRISQIGAGTYGPEVTPAREEDLDSFLSTFEAADVGVIAAQPTSAPAQTIEEHAINLFAEHVDGYFYLPNGETSVHECKQEIDPKRLNPIIRAIAALANNSGGFIFFGIQNGTFRVTGMSNDEFGNIDIVRIVDKAKSYLMPTPEFTKHIITLGEHEIGIINVYKAKYQPIIVSRDGDGLEDGTILFRYPGQSAKIKGGDLLVLLQERDQIMQSKLLDSAAKISKIGTEKAIIVDTSEGILDAGNTKIMIDRELIDQLDFIREGEFDETEGAPTLKLIGDVRATDTTGTVRERITERALTADIVLLSFLRQERVRSPIEFICVSAQVQRQWLPIFYFVHLSDGSIEDTLEVFANTPHVYRISKAKTISRLNDEISAFAPITARTRSVLERIANNEVEDLEEVFEDTLIARAIQALPDNYKVNFQILEILERIFERGADDSAIKSAVFRAACRMDELLFKRELVEQT